jgi:hypothetical protein
MSCIGLQPSKVGERKNSNSADNTKGRGRNRSANNAQASRPCKKSEPNLPSAFPIAMQVPSSRNDICVTGLSDTAVTLTGSNRIPSVSSPAPLIDDHHVTYAFPLGPL